VATAELAGLTQVALVGGVDPTFVATWRLVTDPELSAARPVATVADMLAAVAAGAGCCPVPALLARTAAVPGVAFVPLSDAPPATLALAGGRTPTRPGTRCPPRSRTPPAFEAYRFTTAERGVDQRAVHAAFDAHRCNESAMAHGRISMSLPRGRMGHSEHSRASRISTKVVHRGGGGGRVADDVRAKLRIGAPGAASV
jgi:hypothetical protein